MPVRKRTPPKMRLRRAGEALWERVAPKGAATKELKPTARKAGK